MAKTIITKDGVFSAKSVTREVIIDGRVIEQITDDSTVDGGNTLPSSTALANGLMILLQNIMNVIGSLSTLDTTTQVSLVDAINEVLAKATDASSLTTGTLPGSVLPTPQTAVLGGILSSEAQTHHYASGVDTAGNVIYMQPIAADIIGLALSATVDTTNASNIKIGTLPAAQLPTPTVSTIGGVKSSSALIHQFAKGIDTSGVVIYAQPAVNDISGIGTIAVQNSNNISITGGLITGMPAATNLTGVTPLGQVQSLVASEMTRAENIEAILTSNLNTADANIGILNSLNTIVKSNLVSAINEVLNDVNTEVSRAELSEANINSAIDAKLNGLYWKQSVAVMLDGNSNGIVLSGLYTVQGYTIQAGDRIAVNANAGLPLGVVSTGWINNGVYIASSGAWIRSSDMDEATPINEFTDATFFVNNGTYDNKPFTQYMNVVTVGTDAIAFTQMNGAASLTQGSGVSIVGNQITVVGDNTSITVDSGGVHVSPSLQTVISNNTAAISAEVLRSEAVDAVLIANVGTLPTLTTSAKTSIVAAINSEVLRAETAESALTNTLGPLSALTTSLKTTIVGAINEILLDINNEIVRAEAAENTLTAGLVTTNNDIGVLSSLTTSAKSSIVAALNEVLTDAANASFLTTGTVPAARLPTPTNSALGGVQSSAAATHQFANGISTSGIVTYVQPSYTDISGLGTIVTQNYDNVAITGGSITGMPAAVNPSDVTILSQVQSLIATGVHTWSEVAALINTNVNIAAPGVLIDGTYSVVANNRILLTGQTIPSQNGPWVFNSSSTALTRPIDYASGSAQLAGIVYTIVGVGGSKQGWQYVLNTTSVIVDTTATTWGAFSSAIYGSAPITVSGGAISLNVNGITNSFLAQVPANTIKGNNTTSVANASDLTVAQILTMLGGTTGTGNLVLSTNASLITPNLGTPSAINIVNATGLTFAQVNAAVTGGATLYIQGPSASLWL